MNAPVKALNAGMLRHRISIDRLDHEQDETTGAMNAIWTEIASAVPASVEPLSGREFIAAAQTGSTVSARITLRHRPDLNHAMRVRHGATVYRIKAVLPDHKSGKEWQTLLVESE